MPCSQSRLCIAIAAAVARSMRSALSDFVRGDMFCCSSAEEDREARFCVPAMAAAYKNDRRFIADDHNAANFAKQVALVTLAGLGSASQMPPQVPLSLP